MAIPKQMRAAVFQKAEERVVVKEIDVPEFRTNEILVKLVAASACASDLVPYRGYIGPQTEGLAAGHEGVGVVAAVGESVSQFKVGQRVGFLNTLRTCGSCLPCKDGEDQYCESGKLNQGFDTHGFFAEYAVVKSEFAVEIPESLPIERLSPLFCAGITAFRAVKQLNLPGGGVVGVFGVGGVGRLAIQFANALGYNVLGFDVSEPALVDAVQLGTAGTANSTDKDAVKELVKRFTGNDGLEGAIVASGATSAYEAAVELAGFKATIVTVGVPYTPFNLAVLSLVKKCLRLQGTQTGNPVDIHQMLKLVEKKNIIPDVNLKTIDDVPDIFEDLAHGRLKAKTGILFN